MSEYRFDYTQFLVRFIGSSIVGLPHAAELPVVYGGAETARASLDGDYYLAALPIDLVDGLESYSLDYTFDIDSEKGVDRFSAIIVYTR